MQFQLHPICFYQTGNRRRTNYLIGPYAVHIQINAAISRGRTMGLRSNSGKVPIATGFVSNQVEEARRPSRRSEATAKSTYLP